MSPPGKLAILVGGGPAPGTNSVISAAAIRANLAGVQVLGLLDGFAHLRGNTVPQRKALPIDAVSHIHFRGGSILRTSREVPQGEEQELACVASLRALGVNKLITIGGDETCRAALRITQASQGELRTVHVPKTIDNDLPLPQGIPTLGYETARHMGVAIVRDLLVDAKTTGRWYFLVTMGRCAGHLSLGIAKAAGASLAIIPEEFSLGRPSLERIVDTLVGAIIKRIAHGRVDGVALLAEGLADHLDKEEAAALRQGPDDSPIRLGELMLGDVVKERVSMKLQALGINQPIVAKSIGYELRSADPIPYDMEYARDLGYCAAKYLLEGGGSAFISMIAGQFQPVPFSELPRDEHGDLKRRPVNVETEHYKIARRYMLRLRRDDFQNVDLLARLASTARLSTDEFRQRFSYLIADEAPPIRFSPNISSKPRL